MKIKLLIFSTGFLFLKLHLGAGHDPPQTIKIIFLVPRAGCPLRRAANSAAPTTTVLGRRALTCDCPPAATMAVRARPAAPPLGDGATDVIDISREFATALYLPKDDARAAKAAVGDAATPLPNGNAEGKFVAPKDFELLKVIGMGECGGAKAPCSRSYASPFAATSSAAAFTQGPSARCCRSATAARPTSSP